MTDRRRSLPAAGRFVFARTGYEVLRCSRRNPRIRSGNPAGMEPRHMSVLGHMKCATHSRAVALMLSMIAAQLACGAGAEFPTKPLRFLVGFAPSGGADIVTRTI